MRISGARVLQALLPTNSVISREVFAFHRIIIISAYCTHSELYNLFEQQEWQLMCKNTAYVVSDEHFNIFRKWRRLDA